SGSLPLEALIAELTRWLRNRPDAPFSFKDERGNDLLFFAETDGRMKRVWLSNISSAILSDVSVLRHPLRDKATQHRRIRKAGYPYVLAFLLQPPQLTAEEVAEAWFGRMEYVFQLNDTQPREIRPDKGGIHFFGS